MSKNIAALLDDKAYTVQVRFYNDNSLQLGAKAYTYVTNIEGLIPGSVVVVPVNDTMTFKLATVASVHDGVELDFNDHIEYKWVVAQVNLTPYLDLLERNAKIAKSVRGIQKRRAREAFRQEMLLMLPEIKELI